MKTFKFVIGLIISIVLLHIVREKAKLDVLYSADELKTYNGVDRPEVYLSIKGIIYDVTKSSYIIRNV